MASLAMPRINGTEIKILLLLGDKHAMHVRALRAEMHDYGSISRCLHHLEKLGFIRRERRKTRVMNILTRKGERAAKALRVLRA
ncbi:MAG: MarR family transcriptional regulator [Nitrososphaerales archaeon]